MKKRLDILLYTKDIYLFILKYENNNLYKVLAKSFEDATSKIAYNIYNDMDSKGLLLLTDKYNDKKSWIKKIRNNLSLINKRLVEHGKIRKCPHNTKLLSDCWETIEEEKLIKKV